VAESAKRESWWQKRMGGLFSNAYVMYLRISFFLQVLCRQVVIVTDLCADVWLSYSA
jgi:hypothetical protein